MAKEGSVALFAIDVVNWGNANDTLNASLTLIEGSVDPGLPQKDFIFDSHYYHKNVLEMKVTDEVQILKYQVRGSINDDPVAGCTIVIAPVDEDDGAVDLGDPIFVGGMLVGVAIIVVVVFLLVSRKRKGTPDGDNEDDRYNGENMNWDERSGEI